MSTNYYMLTQNKKLADTYLPEVELWPVSNAS